LRKLVIDKHEQLLPILGSLRTYQWCCFE